MRARYHAMRQKETETPLRESPLNSQPSRLGHLRSVARRACPHSPGGVTQPLHVTIEEAEVCAVAVPFVHGATRHAAVVCATVALVFSAIEDPQITRRICNVSQMHAPRGRLVGLPHAIAAKSVQRVTVGPNRGVGRGVWNRVVLGRRANPDLHTLDISRSSKILSHSSRKGSGGLCYLIV